MQSGGEGTKMRDFDAIKDENSSVKHIQRSKKLWKETTSIYCKAFKAVGMVQDVQPYILPRDIWRKYSSLTVPFLLVAAK